MNRFIQNKVRNAHAHCTLQVFKRNSSEILIYPTLTRWNAGSVSFGWWAQQKMIGIARSATVSHELPERKEGGKQHVLTQQGACHAFPPTKHNSFSFEIAPHQWIKQRRALACFTMLPFFFSTLILILGGCCSSPNIDPHKKTAPILWKKHVAFNGI